MLKMENFVKIIYGSSAHSNSRTSDIFWTISCFVQVVHTLAGHYDLPLFIVLLLHALICNN